MTSLEGVSYLVLHSIEHVSWTGKWTPFCMSILGFFVFFMFKLKNPVDKWVEEELEMEIANKIIECTVTLLRNSNRVNILIEASMTQMLTCIWQG